MLRIIIPFLNESEWLPNAATTLKKQLDHYQIPSRVTLVTQGSNDGSEIFAKNYCQEHDWDFIQSHDDQPSIGRTLNLALSKTKEPYALILPVDMTLTENAWIRLKQALKNPSFDYLVFFKSYSPTHMGLNIYAWMQNWLRLVFFKQWVWTNALVLKKETWQSVPIPQNSFMEDVIWSDQLKKQLKIKILHEKVLVSSRRYQLSKNRMLKNLKILFLFRMKLKNIIDLKAMYHHQ